MPLPPSPLLTLIKRELLTGLRSFRGFLLLIALLAALYWNAFSAMATVAEGYVFMASAMRSLFLTQMIILGIIAFATVPAMAAASYNSEHQDGNYDLLLTTLIPPHTIALAKFLAVLIRALLAGAAALPFTGLVYFYAGVDLDQFSGALAIIVPAGLCNAAIGLWCSRVILSPARSIFATFGIIIAMALAIPAAVALYENFRFLRQVDPFASLWTYASGNPVNPFLLYIAYQLLAALAFLLDAMFGFRRVRVPLISRRESPDGPRESLRQRVSRRFRAPFRPIPDGANPVGWKDLCGSATASPMFALAAFVMVVAAYGAMYSWLNSEMPEFLSALGFIERIVIVLVVPPLVAVLVVKEREETTFDMLRMTLLDAGSVITGKIVGLLRLLKPVLLAVLVCKLAIVFKSTVPEAVNYGPPGYFYWLDLILLPFHLLLVICTALLGATFPRTLVPAVACASGCVALGTFVFLYLQFNIMLETSGDEAAMVAAFLISHVIIAFFAFLITICGATARLAHLWSERVP